jgi:hypothetical protein
VVCSVLLLPLLQSWCHSNVDTWAAAHLWLVSDEVVADGAVHQADPAAAALQVQAAWRRVVRVALQDIMVSQQRVVRVALQDIMVSQQRVVRVALQDIMVSQQRVVRVALQDKTRDKGQGGTESIRTCFQQFTA